MSIQPIAPSIPQPLHGTEVFFSANIDGIPDDENLKALFLADSTGGGELLILDRDTPPGQNPYVASRTLNLEACSDDRRDWGQPAQLNGVTGFVSVYVTEDELRVAFKPTELVPSAPLSNKGQMEMGTPTSYDQIGARKSDTPQTDAHGEVILGSAPR